MPKVDLSAIETIDGSGYPAPFDDRAAGRRIWPMSRPAGIIDFEVNRVELPEGAWSSQRHWHEGEDEFLVVVSGQATLIDDSGETPVGPGDCLAFPKNDGNGHHLVGGPGGCVFVVWGMPEASRCHYPDIDLLLETDGRYVHKDGTPY